MRRLVQTITYRLIQAVVVAIVATIIGGLIRLDYVAYRQRFPDASPWTYLFSR